MLLYDSEHRKNRLIGSLVNYAGLSDQTNYCSGAGRLSGFGEGSAVTCREISKCAKEHQAIVRKDERHGRLDFGVTL